MYVYVVAHPRGPKDNGERGSMQEGVGAASRLQMQASWAPKDSKPGRIYRENQHQPKEDRACKRRPRSVGHVPMQQKLTWRVMQDSRNRSGNTGDPPAVIPALSITNAVPAPANQTSQAPQQTSR
jgi:hypothetical protein